MVFVDDRIGSRDLAAPLQKAGLDVELVRLPFADVAFEGRGNGGRPVNIGVELKVVQDLASSLRTGRLSGHQVPGLVQEYDYQWLVVEGQYGADRAGALTVIRRGHTHRAHGALTLDEVEGRLLTLELQMGLHVRHTAARWQTLRFLIRLYRWWTDTNKDDHRSHLTPHVAPTLVQLSDLRCVLSQIPGVGRVVSKAAETQFRTLARAVTATVDEWATLDCGGRKLGKKTATRVVQFCREGV